MLEYAINGHNTPYETWHTQFDFRNCVDHTLIPLSNLVEIEFQVRSNTMTLHNVVERGRSVLQSQALASLIGLAFLFGATPASAQLGCAGAPLGVNYVCYDDSAVGQGLDLDEVEFQLTNDNGPPPAVVWPYQNDAAKVFIACPISESHSVVWIDGRWYNEPNWMPWSNVIPLFCNPRAGPSGGGVVIIADTCVDGPDPDAPTFGEDGEEECVEPDPSPILLDLDRNQFHLSGGPVLFDIDADGQLETITWVAPGTQDAFLFLDRNGNGVVDDGSELFGNATLLISGEQAKHGYEALAEFDLVEIGGNQDGIISDADSIFSYLGVWIDSNANGIHESFESQSLAEADVLTIGINYRESRRTDSHGNQFRYIGTGLIEVNGKAKNMGTTDVFFKKLAQ